MYCVICVLFGKCTSKHNGNKASAFVKELFRDWKHALQRIRVHNEPRFHHYSSVDYTQFKRLHIEQADISIERKLNKILDEQVQSNREKLRYIVECVLYLAKQCVAFRGYLEDSKYLDDPNGNCGNFQELLLLLIKCGDTVIEDHFKNAAKNATYHSKTIQDEIIRIAGTLVRMKLVDEIKDAFFSIMANEASGISVKEQLSLVLRFVDGEGEIREEFIDFIHCNERTSGQAIADNIFHKLDELGIDVMNCRGQGYDGVGNMTGKNKGVIKIIRDRNPKALGCHCQAHILNLCIARACKITSVVVMMKKICCIQEFFDYPKRMELLLKLTDESDIPNVEKKKSKDCCRTRYVQRVDSFEVFLQMFKLCVEH